MIDRAIARMKSEKPAFVVFTASIWTDREAAASAISFDSLENSLRKIGESNEWSAAHSFEPIVGTRFTNPADFELPDFEETRHEVVPPRWHSALVKIGAYAFAEIVRELHVDRQDFELGINSTKDWYDQTWNTRSSCAQAEEDTPGR